MKTVTLKTARARKMYVLGTLSFLLLSPPLFSQANLGRILGIVTDQTGGVITGATVTIIDRDRGVARTLTTDSAGEYNAPTLIPGTYTVRAEARGFKRLDRENVVLEVGKELRVDLTVQPGEQAQTITVTESIPLVETTNATLGGTLSTVDIEELPLNGRNYQDLLPLRPGEMTYPGGSPYTQSTNNIRPDESVWMLDGVFNTNFYNRLPIATMPGPFTEAATILPIDAIQEFNLEENPKAEYGFGPGAVVNVGIRSGTNTLHGSAYAFDRSDGMDARNTFNPAPQEKTPTNLKQFGGVVSGPIKKDKLFFFGGYEGLRDLIGNAFVTSVPATGTLGGGGNGAKNSMVDALTALQTAGVPISAISTKLFGCTQTAPFTCTGGVIQNDPLSTTSYNSDFPNTNVSDNGIGKIDYRINGKHRVSGLVLVSHYDGNGEDHPVLNSNWQFGDLIRTYTVSANWTWAPSSSVVNEARFGYDLVRFDNVDDDGTKFADGTSYPLNTGVTSTGGFPVVKIGTFGPLGASSGRPSGFDSSYYDIQDNLSYLRGKHTFKFGVDFTRILSFFNNHDTRGEIDFQGNQTFAGSTGLEDFFAGNPSRGFELVGVTARTLNWNSTAGFVQDDWRVTPKLMVNLGLRYSYVSPMKEPNNLVGGFDPTLGMVQQGQPGLNTLWKPDYKDFSPRLGFAWDVTGKGTTVVRGGASKIYSMFGVQQFTGSPFQNFKGGAITAVPTGACTTAVAPGVPCPATFGGTIVLGNVALPASSLNWNGPVFATGGLTGAIACTAPQPCNLDVVNPNLLTPYVVSWNFGVTHAFGDKLSLEVEYVGTHGDDETGFVDLNQINPATGVRPYAAKFPYLKFINQTVNDDYSNYHSLQTTLTERITHGLSFTAGYTYGHGLDNSSLGRFGNLPQNSLNPAAEYGNSDFDVRHRFTLTASYNLPSKKGFGQLLEGWRLNSILILQTGLPWLVNDMTNNFSGSGDLGDRWNFFGNPADFTSGPSSIPYCSGFGVNPATGAATTTNVTCTQQSGISGIVTTFPASLGTACVSGPGAAPDPTTLATGGCYVSGNAVMVPPKAGTFGTMGRNIFRDGGFKNLDFSVFKEFKFKERFGAQFRVEFFNIFNYPNIANPYGASNGYGSGIDPGGPSTFGCGCATPDVAAGNPIIGSGSSRVIQLGLKLTF